MTNRVGAYFLAFCVAFAGVVIPYRDARASLAAVGSVGRLSGPVAAAVAEGGAVSMLPLAAVVLGMVALYVSLKPIEGGEIKAAPKGQAAKEAVNNVPVESTYPATPVTGDEPATMKWTASGGYIGSSADEACAARVSAVCTTLNSPYTTTINATNSYCWGKDKQSGVASQCGSASATYSCPHGGTLNGTVCKSVTYYECSPGDTLSGQTCTHKTCPTGKELFPDGLCYNPASSASQPMVTPATPGYDPQRGDGWAPVPGTVAPGQAQAPLIGDSPHAVGDPANDPATGPQTSEQVSPKTDGGVKVTEKSYDPSSNKTTKRQVTTDPSGVVVDVTVSVQAGNTVTNSSSTQSADPVQFPDWLAHDSSVLATKDAVKSMDDKLKEERDAALTAGEGEKTKADGAVGEAGGGEGRWTKDGIGLPTKDQFQAPETGWLGDWIPSDNGCVSIPMTIGGATSYLDPCPLVSIMKPILNWAIVVMFGISTARYILGRRESE